MSTPSQQFYKLTTQCCQQLAALCRLCDQERAAIESHSVEQLQDTVKEKQALLVQIAGNIDARNQLLNAQGHNADEQGFNAWLAGLPAEESRAIENAWAKLAAQLQESAELNARNEKIVRRSQKNMEQLLSILQGHTARTTLYNQTGSSGNYSAQNTLGKA